MNADGNINKNDTVETSMKHDVETSAGGDGGGGSVAHTRKNRQQPVLILTRATSSTTVPNLETFKDKELMPIFLRGMFASNSYLESLPKNKKSSLAAAMVRQQRRNHRRNG